MHKPPPRPADDEERLEVLRRYRILDTGAERQYDRIVDVAKRQFNVPVAFVAFLDRDRNFLKGRGDIPVSESPRDISFCGHTILSDEVLVVPDAAEDERFNENPLVTGDPNFRFYAGAPLKTESGHRIGTVCVFDMAPREFTEEEREQLRDLAAIVGDHLEMRLAVGNVHDEIETRKKAQAEAQHIANHDSLTGLPNRHAFNGFLASSPVGEGTRHALYADLDAFKQANDMLGHHTADGILLKTGATLKEVLGREGFVTRISGDEFVAIMDGLSDDEVERRAAEILDRLDKPIRLGDHVFVPGLSIGIAGSKDGEDTGRLVQRADSALYAAKQAGGHRYAWYDSAMAAHAARRRTLSIDLPTAIANGEIAVHYQTIHAADDGRVIGAEALARWNHPELGPISPLEFVSIAEETDKIKVLGEHVLRTAVRAVLDWPDLFVAVNVSPMQLLDDNLAQEVLAVAAETGIAPNRLQLELTESVLVQDVEHAKRQIAALRAGGIRVALDDFGTGYSSLGYLRSIPFDKLKIDRSFVTGLNGSGTNAAIVQHIIHLARDLDMRVTAEGIETEEEEVLLRAAGCSSFQGHRFSKPAPAADVSNRLRVPVRRAS